MDIGPVEFSPANAPGKRMSAWGGGNTLTINQRMVPIQTALFPRDLLGTVLAAGKSFLLRAATISKAVIFLNRFLKCFLTPVSKASQTY